MISTKCESCGKNYKLKDTAAGKTVNCVCGNVVKIPLEPNLDENGVALKKSKAKQTLPNQDPPEAKPLTKEQRRYQTAPDLTNKKVCSKCKTLVEMSIKDCPKCGFSTTGIKFDQAKREETTRKLSGRIFNVGKYVIPLVFMVLIIYFFNIQLKNLEVLRELESKVLDLLNNEKTKMDIDHKTNVDSETISNFYLADEFTSENPYFLAIPKNDSDVPFSLSGNGFFTLKKAGVCYFVKYTNSGRAIPRFYIEDENGKLVNLNSRSYDFLRFESIAYKIAF